MRTNTCAQHRSTSSQPRHGTAPWWRALGGWSLGALSQARVVNSLDRERLYDAIPFTIPLADHVSELFRLLAVATPLSPERVPPDLVTMNSVICVRDADTGETDTFDLVYPFDADRRPLGRSVVAPFGAAIFGRCVGERTTWRTPRGERRVVIEALQYQPEREGHYDR